MPLIELGQAAWHTVPAHDDGLAHAHISGSGGGRPSQAGSGAGSGRNDIGAFARRVADEIRSAKSRSLIVGGAPAELLVLLTAESADAATRHRRGGHGAGSRSGPEVTRFTGAQVLERLAAAAAADGGVRFLICGDVTGSPPGAAHNGYAASLLRAGMLANAIVSAALESGWSAAMDFAPQHDVAEAARHADCRATHIGTVYACRQGRS
jgi:hypothetical protein